MSLQQHLGLNVAGMFLENCLKTYVDSVRRRMRLCPEIDAEDKLVFLQRVAPRPNNALKVAAYFGL
jgi:hypothetical protein